MVKGFVELEKRQLKSPTPPEGVPGWWTYWFGWHMSYVDARWLQDIGWLYMFEVPV